jgi:hypothetical protein
MIDDERLKNALRATLEGTMPGGPSRDLWPLIVQRGRKPGRWSWLDLAVAVVVLILLSMRPEWLWLLAYHL